MSDSDYGSVYAERQISRSRNPLRKLIKKFYLKNVLKDIKGPTIDFGCGAGQLLEKLPAGSMGLEANSHLVRELHLRGLCAQVYSPESDQLLFKDIKKGSFNTFVMSHVFEHFVDAASGLKTILDSCRRLEVSRVIIVVPGQKGYLFDDTHRTFITQQFIIDFEMENRSGFKVTSFSYFPIDRKAVGDNFTFHELKIIFDAI